LFTRTVEEAREKVKRREVLQGAVGEYEVYVTVEGRSDPVRLTLYPTSYEGMRLPLLQMHPKYIADLERLAEALPEVLKVAAKGMREADLPEDLRPAYERAHEALMTAMNTAMDKGDALDLAAKEGRAAYDSIVGEEPQK
jgi:hypothetical protein